MPIAIIVLGIASLTFNLYQTISNLVKWLYINTGNTYKQYSYPLRILYIYFCFRSFDSLKILISLSVMERRFEFTGTV